MRNEKCGFLIWPFLKSVLIFHHWDFYSTDSIPDKMKKEKKKADVILFFKYNCSYYVQKDGLCTDKLPHFNGAKDGRSARAVWALRRAQEATQMSSEVDGDL